MPGGKELTFAQNRSSQALPNVYDHRTLPLMCERELRCWLHNQPDMSDNRTGLASLPKVLLVQAALRLLARRRAHVERGPSSHLSTRPNISESHSEISTRVPHCITGAVAGRSFEYPPEHQRVP